MIVNFMKSFIKTACLSVGIEVRRTQPPQPGSAKRPIASGVKSFLEDVKARGFSPRGIVDIGANRGDWTRVALSVFPSTPVIMIEPQNEMQEHLVALSKESPNCTYIRAGAGREAGELVQTIWDDLAGSSFLPETSDEELKSGRQRRTKVITIDAALSGLRDFHPDLMKLDIQGFELEALSGAKTTFGLTEVYILETSLFRFMSRMPITRDVISFMSDKGYELYDIAEYLRRPHDGALGQVDLAFVKSEGMFRRESAW
jgi:FkbM family methyltransferase